jgi:CRP/FNR family transcriptional regulator
VDRNVTLPVCNDCTLQNVTLCGTYHTAAQTEFDALDRTFDRFSARRIIYRKGVRPSSLFVVQSGWAYAFRVLSSGRRHIIDFFVPGDSIGLHVDPTAPLPYSVQALTDLALCGFTLPNMIDQGLAHPSFCTFVRTRVSEYVRMLENQIVCVSRYPAMPRIACLIINLRERLRERGLADGDTFAFPLTQSHIGDALGLTAAHVNRTLGELRNEGILSLGQGELTILDLERLSELAKSVEG